MNIKWGKTLFLIGIVTGIGGCTDNAPEAASDTVAEEKISSQDHVWKTQTDALDKAKNLNNVLEKAQAERVKQLDDETP